jgi:hypothetical protein
MISYYYGDFKDAENAANSLFLKTEVYPFCSNANRNHYNFKRDLELKHGNNSYAVFQ